MGESNMPLTIVNTHNEADTATTELAGAWTVETAVVDGITYVFVGAYSDHGITVFRLESGGALTHVQSIADDASLHLTQVRVLKALVQDGTTFLYATGAADRGISAFRVNADGTLTSLQNIADSATTELWGANGIAFAIRPSGTYMYVAGESDAGLTIYKVLADGTLSFVDVVRDETNVEYRLAGVFKLDVVSVGSSTYLLAPGYQDDGVTVYRILDDGRLEFASSVRDTAVLEIDGAVDVASIAIAGVTYVYVAGVLDNGINVFTLSASGVLTSIQSIPQDSTTPLTNAISVKPFTVDLVPYLAVGRQGGIGIFRINADGTLTLEQNIADDATLRIQDYSYTDVIALNGRQYLIGTGYGDSGVSVFDVGTAGVTLDFNHVVYEDAVTSDVHYTHSVITEDGFVIDNLRTSDYGEFGNFTTDNVGWSHGPGTPYLPFGPPLVEIARVAGTPFDLLSAKFDTRDATYTGDVIATGTKSDGSIVTVTLDLDMVKGLQLFTFSGFTDLVSVQFGGPDNFQFDDILVAFVRISADAKNDSATTTESAPVSDGVFEDNGSGADSDADGDAFSVTAVNGDTTKVGQPVTLASGALVTLSANGSYTYDPNRAFDALISAGKAAATGAVNSSATDSFTYTITGGDTATVTVTIAGEDSPADQLEGDGNANTITGLSDADLVYGHGGADTLDGGGGADKLYGGDGDDTLKVSGGTTGANTPLEEAHGAAGSDHLIVDYSALTDQVGLYVSGSNADGFTGFVDIPDGTRKLAFSGIDRITATAGAGNDILTGIGGNDVLKGGAGHDYLLGRGGDDRLEGGDGDDRLISGAGADALVGGGGRDVGYFGADFGAGDSFNGGDNNDIVILQGDYSARTVLTGITNLGELGSISLFPTANALYAAADSTPNSYNLASVDSNVGAGQVVRINGSALAGNENLTFDGSAETDGSFLFHGGLGTDILTGGAQNDNFVFGHRGQYGASDRLAGGAGYDVVYLRGDYVIDFTSAGFGATTFNSIESIGLLPASNITYSSGGDGSFSYQLKWSDALLTAGQIITVNGSRLSEGETMNFDGSLETDGRFRLFGGEGQDLLLGGRGDDLIYGNGESDTLYGGGGNDIFRYQSIQDSLASGNRDGIQDFSAGDLLDLSRIDADVHTAGDQAFVFVANGLFTGQAGQVRAIQAVGSIWAVEADVDGDTIADLSFFVVTIDQDPITAGDFIL
jgi:VCBS repeat-containing protein